jgi:hypothetical protein
MEMGLPAVIGSILRMECTPVRRSGTVLWSVLLPASSETVVTHTGPGQGGCVRYYMPLRRGDLLAAVGGDR